MAQGKNKVIITGLIYIYILYFVLRSYYVKNKNAGKSAAGIS
jgi:hypothetical protein